MRPRHAPERGSTDLVLVLPLAMTMVMVLVQLAMWAHAQHRAQAMAEQVLAATRAADASTATGEARASEVTEDLGGRLLRGTDVSVTRTTATATVQVRAFIRGPVPGWEPPVHAELSAPVERAGVRESP
ncbi:hypothetical protein F4561_005224 [Lipingzhangella halophila]|uniref:TadE-like protein n=1 Tax=Lipingzhangella halophila TaxID=1783352 RepID=A0A7W7RLY4_9ACTN|nr:TadE/TadG family type IV pilus assembly protein [Lipingzhangella halophila]MBB4934404.1 hypothetical protein [Lipingzhangella halophila]